MASRKPADPKEAAVEKPTKPKAKAATKTDDGQAIARRIADIAEDKQATDIVILNLSGASALTDYFVICSADSSPQVRAIVDAVDTELSARGIVPLGVEGKEGDVWVLADYNDVILNVFKTEARAFYHLEQLWGDAPVVPRQPKAAAVRRPRKTTAESTS